MNAAFQATKSAIISMGFLSGFVFLALTVLVVYNSPIIPISLLGLAFLCFTICLILLLMAARKFGNNEIEIASELVKKANIFFFVALISAYLVIVFWLVTYGIIYALVFIIISILLIIFVWKIGKKKFKYW